jgi:hypothetical protein
MRHFRYESPLSWRFEKEIVGKVPKAGIDFDDAILHCRMSLEGFASI